MAVVSCKRIFDGECSVDQFLNRTYQPVYQIVTDAITDGFVTALTAAGLPALYTFYVGSGGEYDTGSVLQSYSPKRTDANVWEVTCNYASWASVLQSLRGSNPQMQKALSDSFAQGGIGTSGSGAGQPLPGGFDAANPVSRPPRVSINWRSYQRVMEADRNGVPCTNSSQEKFDPPVETDDNRMILTISRNELTIALNSILTWQDSINNDSFQGQPPYSWKMRVTADLQFENKILFWQVNYEFEYRSDKWYPLKVLDAGYHTLPFGSALPGTRILDASGNPSASPVPLYTIVGNEIPALSGSTGDVIVLPRGTNNGQAYAKQYREFYAYRQIAFNQFNFPTLPL